MIVSQQQNVHAAIHGDRGGEEGGTAPAICALRVVVGCRRADRRR